MDQLGQYYNMATTINGTGTSTFGGAVDLGSNNLTTTGNADVAQVITDAPYFYAYGSADQTLSASTWTKAVLDTEVHDTASCFDNATNYRFTPNVAGYYLFNHSMRFNFTTSMTQANTIVWKNGGSSEKGQMNLVRNQNQAFHVAGSCIHYLNGSTDYVEFYVYMAGTGTLSLNYAASNAMCWWEGILLRAA